MNFSSRWKKAIVKRLDIPQDTLLDVTRVTWIDNGELFIENYLGIQTFTSESIVLLLDEGEIRVEGVHLELKSVRKGELKITGRIQAVKRIEEEKGRWV
ncbi:YabP/YqfC family sporulation protein [Salsuginibacillus kocurii]|uniref:YabP/YqfC family sporulation protein n=1 Tax=Salsuginibacillus kocurii TaxID=427078 RepID=UPI0003777BD0|nr:YabP/YqfC family sporulation protein [Salsuginibacillus kocurii]